MPLFNASSSNTPSTTTSPIANTLDDTTAVELAPSNSSRKGLAIHNPLSATLYIDSANTVSSTDYLVAVPPNGYYEAPYSYTGSLYGILSTGGTGSVLVREFL